MKKGDSLKTKLFDAVKGAYPNEFSLESVNELCDGLEKKRSNGERRLRELCEPNETGYAPVRTIRNDKGFITGYLYQELKLPQRKPEVERKQDALFNYQGSYAGSDI